MDKDKTKQRSYAYLFYHYNMVKDGGEVGTRINKPNAQQDLDERNGFIWINLSIRFTIEM